jgi:L-rhamnose mutarotase
VKRNTFVIKLKPGMKEEYKKRHDNIWPELKKMISKGGQRNYSIWYYNDLLFAYYETDDEGLKPLTTEAEIELSKK